MMIDDCAHERAISVWPSILKEAEAMKVLQISSSKIKEISVLELENRTGAVFIDFQKINSSKYFNL